MKNVGSRRMNGGPGAPARLSLLLVALLLSPSATQAGLTAEKLTASDGEVSDRFGRSVSISGNVALVGAGLANHADYDSGAAYVYRFDGSSWVEEQKLTASDGERWDNFGLAVAVSGDVALVGSHADDDDGPYSGAAYVFRFDGSTWVEEQKLTASNAQAYDQFGRAVSVSGDVALVGAGLADGAGANAGAAYMYRFDGTTWAEEQVITAGDAQPGDLFGSSLSVSGDVALVGARAADGAGINAGAAYVLRFDGTTWTEEQKLTVGDGQAYDYFGLAVSLSGDAALVGAPYADRAGSNSGAAYAYRFDGTSWVEEQELTATDGQPYDYFGISVSVSGDVALAGAYLAGDAVARSGLAHVYRYDGTSWAEDRVLTATNAQAYDYFGYSVSASGDLMLVGAEFDDSVAASAGAAYVFRETCGSDVTDGLLSRWELDGDALDAVGQSHGTLVDDYEFQTGHDGQAIHFAGNGAIDGDNPALPQGSAPRTFAAWIWIDQDHFGTIFNYGTFEANQRAGMLYIDGRLYWVGEFNDVIGNSYLPIGEWVHVAITYDASSVIRLYVDGSLDRAQSIAPHDTTGTNWRIGNGADIDFYREAFRGRIDQVSVYDRALSDEEIQSLFAGPCPDEDGDGVDNSVDNCPVLANPDQVDTDEDGIGDACDPDDDGDGIDDGSDNCQFTVNADQADADDDGQGDPCDGDLDGDGLANEADNCPETPNPAQTDTDSDGAGDACDADDDGDGICDAGADAPGCTAGPDNCPTVANPDQSDTPDGDGIGDACDADRDNDGVLNDADNCPVAANASQDDTDLDGEGDACDADDDDDGVLDGDDNCPLIVNVDQADLDGDGQGDPCDGDLDGDGSANEDDNCVDVPNSGQADFDLDGAGDACDDDIDDDGVLNAADVCAFTPLGDTVLETGCSLEQLCPCAGPRGTTSEWRNHGKYVSCNARATNRFVDAGLMTEDDKGAVMAEVGSSDCGH